MELTLKQLDTAKQWYSAENNHDYVMADYLSAKLALDGWEIGMDESDEPDAGCFCVKQGDINGNTYIALGKRMLDVEDNES
jgi:hypothetical protein